MDDAMEQHKCRLGPRLPDEDAAGCINVFLCGSSLKCTRSFELMWIFRFLTIDIHMAVRLARHARGQRRLVREIAIVFFRMLIHGSLRANQLLKKHRR